VAQQYCEAQVSKDGYSVKIVYWCCTAGTAKKINSKIELNGTRNGFHKGQD